MSSINGLTSPLMNAGIITLDTAQRSNYNSFLYLKPKFGTQFPIDGTFYSFSPAQTTQIGINLNKHDSNGNIINSAQIGIDSSNNVIFSSILIQNDNPTTPIISVTGCDKVVKLLQNIDGGKPSFNIEANPNICLDNVERIKLSGTLEDGRFIPITLNEGGTDGIGILKIPDPGFALDVDGDIQSSGSFIPGTTAIYNIGSDTSFWNTIFLSSNGIRFSPNSSITTSPVTGNIQCSPGVDLSGSIVPSGDLIPGVPNTYNLGSSSSRWKQLWVNGINANSNVELTSNLIMTGNTADLVINNASSVNTFKVFSSSGNTSIAGTLDVTSTTNLFSVLNVTGNLNVNTNKFNITGTNGNVSVNNGTFTINGTTGLVTASNVYPFSTNNELGSSTKLWSNVWTSNVNFGNSVVINRNANDMLLSTAVGNKIDIASNLLVREDLNVGISSNFVVDGTTGNTCNTGTLNVLGDVGVNNNRVKITASTGNIQTAGQYIIGSNSINSYTILSHDGTDGYNYTYSGNYYIGADFFKTLLSFKNLGGNQGQVGININGGTNRYAGSTLDVNGKAIFYDGNVSEPRLGPTGGNGARLILTSAGTFDYPFALGIDAFTLWYATDGLSSHKWYLSTLNLNTLDSGGMTSIYKLRNVASKLVTNNTNIDLSVTTSYRYVGNVFIDLNVTNAFVTFDYRMVSFNLYCQATLGTLTIPTNLKINGVQVNWSTNIAPPVTIQQDKYALITFFSYRPNIWYGLIVNYNM